MPITKKIYLVILKICVNISRNSKSDTRVHKVISIGQTMLEIHFRHLMRVFSNVIEVEHQALQICYGKFGKGGYWRKFNDLVIGECVSLEWKPVQT